MLLTAAVVVLLALALVVLFRREAGKSLGRRPVAEPGTWVITDLVAHPTPRKTLPSALPRPALPPGQRPLDPAFVQVRALGSP